VLRIWDHAGALLSAEGGGSPVADAAATATRVLNLALGMTFRLSVRLEHRHIVYGTYDPLVGRRGLELVLGTVRLHDTLPLDVEHHIEQPGHPTFAIPEARRDTQFFVSAPDSIHLSAHLPGNAFFCFPEVPVRHATIMRLKFSYLIAAGTEGTCRVRITQYKDSPVSWKVLAEGRRELPLTSVGRWAGVELIFRTESQATSLTLDFRIDGFEVRAGEIWIDDVSLDPLGARGVDPRPRYICPIDFACSAAMSAERRFVSSRVIISPRANQFVKLHTTLINS
jgi:hypothetical protein